MIFKFRYDKPFTLDDDSLVRGLKIVSKRLQEIDKDYQSGKFWNTSVGLCFLIEDILHCGSDCTDYILDRIYEVNFGDKKNIDDSNYFWWDYLTVGSLVKISKDEWFSVRKDAVDKTIEFYKNKKR